jgi:hypothetical protein
MRLEPYSIDISDAVLEDLRARIFRTRWPACAPGRAWEQGTDLNYLRRLLNGWVNDFDWRREERRLNAFPPFLAEVDGVEIHFIHQRAVEGNGIPLILTHG